MKEKKRKNLTKTSSKAKGKNPLYSHLHRGGSLGGALKKGGHGLLGNAKKKNIIAS